MGWPAYGMHRTNLARVLLVLLVLVLLVLVLPPPPPLQVVAPHQGAATFSRTSSGCLKGGGQGRG